MVNIAVRQANNTDIGVLHFINQRTLPQPYTIKQWTEIVYSPTIKCMIIESSKSIVGYCVTEFQKNATAHIASIAIMLEYQKLGLANRLVSHAEMIAKQAGAQRIVLEVNEHNLAAIGLYQKAGYHHYGKQERFYNDGSTALLLEKVL